MIDSIFKLAWSLPALLFAITIHEYSHGRMADFLGDPTPRLAGRLTLNPIAHLDPIGALSLLIFRFGWAKPVPINPLNFKNYRRDTILTALAGPASNLLSAFLFSWVFKISLNLANHISTNDLPQIGLVFIRGWFILLSYGVIFNLVLAVFNLIPLPPLDGSLILLSLLPAKWSYEIEKYKTYSYILLVIFIFTGVVEKIMHPILNFFLITFNLL